MAIAPHTHSGLNRKKWRVLVVENHRFFRENLVNWITSQEGLECCGEAESAAEAQLAFDAAHPDLVILDLTLNDSSGFDFLKWMNGRTAKFPVIVLSQLEEDRYANPALEAGARGYVSKSSATEDLHPAIHAIRDGACYVSGRGAFPAAA